jgi:Flp pilus assembly protein TadD
MPDRPTSPAYTSPAFTPTSAPRSSVDAASVSLTNATIADRIKTGVQLHQSKRNSEAAEVFRGILQETPDNAESLQVLGWIEAEQGEVKNGIAKIQRAIELSPKSELYYLNLLNLLKLNGIREWRRKRTTN